MHDTDKILTVGQLSFHHQMQQPGCWQFWHNMDQTHYCNMATDKKAKKSFYFQTKTNIPSALLQYCQAQNNRSVHLNMEKSAFQLVCELIKFQLKGYTEANKNA
jgi:hypothetical protein